MSQISLNALTKSKDARAVLCEHLTQLEASLEETRNRVMGALDEELVSIRHWMDSLQSLEPALSIYRPEKDAAQSAGKVAAATKPSKPNNIVQLSSQDFANVQEPMVTEPPLDPALEKATMEELNAALAAVFEHMGHGK